jgi:hypothetical protein
VEGVRELSQFGTGPTLNGPSRAIVAALILWSSLSANRIQDMKRTSMTLDQVKAARPIRDYDGRYGATTGPWTTDMFVEAVYRSL